MVPGKEREVAEQQQRYQKYLSEIETLQDQIKHDQIEYEAKKKDYEEQIQMKKDHVEQLRADYVKLVKEIASKAVYSRSGKYISNQVFNSIKVAIRSVVYKYSYDFNTGLTYAAKKFFSCG